MTLTSIAERLREAGIAPDDARHEALLLLEHVTRLSPAALLADRGRDFDSPALLDAVERRAAREPLQYILGAWDFCGLTLRVDRRCLIPRPDTEVVAERAAELLPANGRFLDLCTGSGCIAAAVCALSADRHTSGVALELDPDTADLARENLAALGFADRCPVVTADLRDDPFGEEVFDVIVSNPPYVTAEEMAGLAPELAWEPREALTDGGDGLSLIAAILRLYRKHLAPGGVLL
ncbi:MAG: peptide chain release factor N(5)-glutamine methyltransferase, partial [Clostridia bacterium]|nr:peptide chain release factor N(5)-glutamine methyltransferase [Clostridia bacterium]